MTSAIAHRGPDGDGFADAGPVTFGHCRLAIIDPSERGLQPMKTPDGMGTLVYNGEVYNHRELRLELESEGARFNSESDSEVVLYALHNWGIEAALHRFNGMFAFAYFDAREHKLWLARDRFGIKALSVAQRDRRILFASEDKAILAASAFPSAIDTRVVTLALACQYTDSHLSSFSGIRRLGPGEVWEISENGIQQSRFWHALDHVDPHRLLQFNDAEKEARERLESLLRRSVAMHCLADARRASACSSGIDSGLVTIFAKDHIDDHCGYVVDPDTGVSEAKGAMATGRNADVAIKRVSVHREAYLRSFADAAFHLENGNMSHASPAMLCMIRQCKEDGVKVLLTGEGSDELFGGYRWHASAAKRAQSILLMPFLRLPGSRKRANARLRLSAFHNSIGSGSAQTRSALTPALYPEHGLLHSRIMDLLQPIRSTHDRVFAGAGIFDLYGHMQDIIHRHDRLSMASSVELRVPFLENEIADFALHLPPRYKYRWRNGKWLLKNVARAYIPKSNIYARKKGFPITSAYTQGTEELLRQGCLPDAMKWSRLETDQLRDMARSDNLMRLRLVGQEVFMRIYGDGQTSQNVGEALVAAATNAGSPELMGGSQSASD